MWPGSTNPSHGMPPTERSLEAVGGTIARTAEREGWTKGLQAEKLMG
jgi:hypothetical protein